MNKDTLTNTETCSARTGDRWQRRACGKPAKGHIQNGEPVCGIHLAAEQKRLASNAKWAAEWEEKQARAAVLKELTAQLGMGFADSGYIRITEAEARTLIAQLEEKP